MRCGRGVRLANLLAAACTRRSRACTCATNLSNLLFAIMRWRLRCRSLSSSIILILSTHIFISACQNPLVITFACAFWCSPTQRFER